MSFLAEIVIIQTQMKICVREILDNKRMADELYQLLKDTIDREESHLRALSNEAAAIHPAGESSWSPKQELGHLIDSAANNHQRFVRGALDSEYRGPGYAQNDWVAIHAYQEMAWPELVSTWLTFNKLLLRVLRNSSENKLGVPCFIGTAAAPVTLGFVIDDYVLHMRHHIDHLLQRQSITEYPRAAARQAS